MQKKYRIATISSTPLEDDGAGTHSKAIHSIHEDSTVEEGLLMVILSLAQAHTS
jgi:hypothetical protein